MNFQERIAYCPVCGSDVEPDDDPMGDNRFNCPEHGRIMVETFQYG